MRYMSYNSKIYTVVTNWSEARFVQMAQGQEKIESLE